MGKERTKEEEIAVLRKRERNHSMKFKKVYEIFLLLSGLCLGYIEGLIIKYLNRVYFPEAWHPHQTIVWALTFGVFQGILFLYYGTKEG